MDTKTRLSLKHIFLLIVSLLGLISLGFTHYITYSSENSLVISKIKMSGWTMINLINEKGLGFWGFVASLFIIIFLICCLLLFIWSIVGILNDLNIIKRKPNFFKCKFENISKYLLYGLMGSAFLIFFFAMIYSFVAKETYSELEIEYKNGVKLGFGLFFNLFVYTGGFWMFFLLIRYGKLNKVLVKEVHSKDFFDVEHEEVSEEDIEDISEEKDEFKF